MHSISRRWAFATAALAAGFSGMAVVGTILTGTPLLVLELALLAVATAVLAVVLRGAPRLVVREVALVARAGLVAGAAATVVYDTTRATLSLLDPSPYNPFEVLRLFGLGVLRAGAPYSAVMIAGGGIHLLNGSTFGVIYAVIGGRHASTPRAALGAGLLWGLTLELIQSILYPGWLHITSVLREFLVISGLGHLAYGTTLGLVTRPLLPRPARAKEAA